MRFLLLAALLIHHRGTESTEKITDNSPCPPCLCGEFQEQVDQADVLKRAAISVDGFTIRVRAVKTVPEAADLQLHWRRGGEGLGGEVIKGELKAGEPVPLKDLVAKGGGWHFLTVVVAAGTGKKATAITEAAVEVELSDAGKPVKAFVEPSPKGATIGLAVPMGAAGRAEFIALFQGLSTYARARRERLEKTVAADDPLPKKFGIIGHVGGYGEGGAGKGGGAGYGVRHCNPEILQDELRTLRMIGVNGMVGTLRVADAAGKGDEFRRVYWGGPGSGSPMNFLKKKAADAESCPFDPALKPHLDTAIAHAIEEHQAARAKESWGIWTDEIGVFVKEHAAACKACETAFRKYVASLGVPGAETMSPFNLWKGPAPKDSAEALRYYYTNRFMTYATAQVFPDVAKKLKEAGIYLYAMQGPTPSWNGASLDWNEFYDLHANTAFVFETSNRDPRAWPWESYLADIGRGICARHSMPFGCLVKPHRGAPEQRMLAVVARGATVVEWYTYGPDYSKGDSFSSRPDLLERCARAARFLGRTEDVLYGAKPAVPAEVAFVTPRSSEIWGKAANDIAPFEDAKWVYLALRHAHVPVDILSEQQLAEGDLKRYKALYIPGPNLRGDAAGKLKEWLEAGGLAWTDALGLSRDEANQPLGLIPGDRALKPWGTVAGYKATGFSPIAGAGWEKADFVSSTHKIGKGEIVVAAPYAGLAYSQKVRRADFDMRADFDPAIRALVADPALARITRPMTTSDPLVEAVLLEKEGRRSVALMNWGYKGHEFLPVEKLRVELPPGVTSVRSAVHGAMALEGRSVTLPKMPEIDLLILE